jgi:DeoR/GlpR family transcriptional regulator of sugar metabolism
MSNKARPDVTSEKVDQSLIELSAYYSHPAEDALAGYIGECLPIEREKQISEHLGVCEPCANLVLKLTTVSRDWLQVEASDVLRSTREKLKAVFQEIIAYPSSLVVESDTQTPQGQSSTGGNMSNHAEMAIEAKTIRDFVPFALDQKTVDSNHKQLVGQWAAQYFRLTSGAGLFFDAGSSCLKAWEAIRDRIASREISHINVVTNNFMILQDWANQHFSRLLDTSVDMAGESFDPLHLAFYGEGIRRRLTMGAFRPAIVYIGTSGIEFDEHGSILFGYHAKDPEREVKQVLFECPCKARVILATAKKVGNAGGTVFDLLALKDNRDVKAPPIYLITTPPEPGGPDEEAYERSLRIYGSDQLQDAITSRGLDFQWIEVRGLEDWVNITAQVLSEKPNIDVQS